MQNDASGTTIATAIVIFAQQIIATTILNVPFGVTHAALTNAQKKFK